jgi:hypothetical protein
MIEPNTDVLTLVFVFLIVFLPITLHTLFGGDRGGRSL